MPQKTSQSAVPQENPVLARDVLQMVPSGLDEAGTALFLIGKELQQLKDDRDTAAAQAGYLDILGNYEREISGLDPRDEPTGSFLPRFQQKQAKINRLMDGMSVSARAKMKNFFKVRKKQDELDIAKYSLDRARDLTYKELPIRMETSVGNGVFPEEFDEDLDDIPLLTPEQRVAGKDAYRKLFAKKQEDMQLASAKEWFQNKAIESKGDWDAVLKLAADPIVQKGLGIDFTQAKGIILDLQTNAAVVSNAEEKAKEAVLEKQKAGINFAFNEGDNFEALKLIDESNLVEDKKQERRLDVYKSASLQKKARITDVQQEVIKSFYAEYDRGELDKAIKVMKNDTTMDIDTQRQYIAIAEKQKELKRKEAKGAKLERGEIVEAIFYDSLQVNKFEAARSKIQLMDHLTAKERYDLELLVDEKEQVLTGKKAYDPNTFSVLKRQALRLQSQADFESFLNAVQLAEVGKVITEQESATLRSLAPSELESNIRTHVDKLTTITYGVVMGDHLDKDTWMVLQRTEDPSGDLTQKLIEFPQIQAIKRWAAGQATQEIINQVTRNKDWDRATREAEAKKIQRDMAVRVSPKNLTQLKADYEVFLSTQ